MLLSLQKAFELAHRQTVSEFSDSSILVWLPASRGYGPANGYTVAIPAMKGSVRGQSQPGMGMLSVALDGIVIDALKKDFPYPPRPDDFFVIGPAAEAGSGNSPGPPPGSITYRILTVGATEINSHYHITAERHD